MNLFKKPLTPFPSFTDAEKYAANGYCTLPVDRGLAEEGRETPSSGPWAFGTTGLAAADGDRYTVGILAGRLSLGGGMGGGRDDCAATRIAVVSVDVHTNKRVARELEAVIRRWAGEGPVRESRDSPSLLFPFRVHAEHDPRQFGQTSEFCKLPGDAPYGPTNKVLVRSAATCFLAAGGPFTWRDDRDLLAVSRDQLPALTPADARDIVSECNRVFYQRSAA